MKMGIFSYFLATEDKLPKRQACPPISVFQGSLGPFLGHPRTEHLAWSTPAVYRDNVTDGAKR